MPRGPDALVNPDLLVWARESALMTQEMAAEKLGVATERLDAWEKGKKKPTVNQVRTMSRVYEQCFAAFYLPEAPPVFKPPTHDYRLMPEGEGRSVSPAIAFEMRRALDRREVLLELAREEKEKVRKFPLRETDDKSSLEIAKVIRTALDVSLIQQKRWRSADVAFRHWRAAAENLGALVFQSSKVPLEEMRGFSISKSTLPIVVLNRKDSYAGRSFTLMHELGHLTLRNSGVCDLIETRGRPTGDQKVEVYCNEVAGSSLVPPGALTRTAIVKSHDRMQWTDQQLAELAKEFAVSREVILRRLLTLERTTHVFYERKRRQFLKEYQQLAKSKENEASRFVPPSTDAVSIAGKPYVRRILGAYYEDRLNASEASELLDVRMKHFNAMSQAVGMK